MNIEKAKKRIAKQVKKGVNGYPKIVLEYFGKTSIIATEVIISFLLKEGDEPQQQKLVSEGDVREDEVVQSTLIKIIDRADALTVVEIDGTTVIS